MWRSNTDANLTCKLITFLALTTALSASMIQHLNAEFMPKHNDKCIFYFNKLQRSSRKGQAPSSIPYFVFGEDKALCVVQTLNNTLTLCRVSKSKNLLHNSGADPEILKRGALYVGHYSWATKKYLCFRWSEMVKITLETKAFGETFSVFSNVLHFYI